MEITITLEVDQTLEETVDLSEFDMSQEEWEALSLHDKILWLYENVINELEDPVWFVSNIEEN